MSWNSELLVNSLRFLPLSLNQQQQLWNALVARHPVVFVGNQSQEVLRFAREVASRWQTTDDEQREIADIYQEAGVARPDGVPFRVPHHSTTLRRLLGGLHAGGASYGELSLAHNGVLLLDDVTDFGPAEVMHLGQALKEKSLKLLSAKGATTLPGRPRFVFVTAGTCICRHSGCACSADLRVRHEARVAKYVGMLGASRIEVDDWVDTEAVVLF